jgi:hypothetical protein
LYASANSGPPIESSVTRNVDAGIILLENGNLRACAYEIIAIVSRKQLRLLEREPYAISQPLKAAQGRGSYKTL